MASARSENFLYLIAVILATTGRTGTTGPFNAARASESAISFNSNPEWPGTHNNFKSFSCGGISVRNVFRAVDFDEAVRDVHTDMESVIIIALWAFKSNLRRARIIAKSSASKMGVKSGSLNENDQPSEGE